MPVLLNTSQMYASVATGSNYNTTHPQNSSIRVHLPDHDGVRGAATIWAAEDGNPGLLEEGDVISFTITIGGTTYQVNNAVVGQTRNGSESSGTPQQKGTLTATGKDQTGQNVALLLSQGSFQAQNSPFFVDDTQFGGRSDDDVYLQTICYARGTRIATDRGPVAVEALRRGDAVQVLRGGVARLRWVGQSVIRAEIGAGGAGPDNRLVCIPRDAFGNREAVLVTVQHRLALCVAGQERLVKVKFLAEQGLRGCRFIADGRRVEIFHLLTRVHEVVNVCGMWAETFKPGAQSLRHMEGRMRADLFRAFPRIGQAWEKGRFVTGNPYPPALPILTRAEFEAHREDLAVIAPPVGTARSVA